MKKIVVPFLILLCLAAIIMGKIHWNNQLATTAAKANGIQVGDKQTVVKNGKVDQSTINIQLLDYTKNLPKEIVTKIKKSITNGKPVQLVMMGSESTPDSSNGWPAIVEKNLMDTYGKNVFHVTVKEFDKLNSSQVLEQGLYKEITALKPDILLIEPFTLNDNGTVRIEDSLGNLDMMINNIKEELPNVSIILQPSQPIYNAVFYPNELDELKKYANKNGYPYLDHWTNWPDYTDKELLNYLSKNSSEPNEKGNQVWAEYVSNYFISK